MSRLPNLVALGSEVASGVRRNFDELRSYFAFLGTTGTADPHANIKGNPHATGHSQLLGVEAADATSTDTAPTKHISNLQAYSWTTHVANTNGNPHGTDHSMLDSIGQVDPTSTNATRDKHVSNNDAKGWTDSGVTGGNAHDHNGGDGAQIAYSTLSGLPTLGTAAALNVPASGDAAVGEVVKGDDTRLTDARTPTTHSHWLTATATLDFGSVSAASSADLTITVTGAAVGDAVVLGVPNGSVTANTVFFGWVSATNTVTIRCTNNDAASAADPASGTFRATVLL